MGSVSAVKVLFLIPHLGGGGAERVVEAIARSLDPEKYEVHLGLVTRYPGQAKNVQEDFPPSVRVYVLGGHRVRRSAWKVLRLVWRIKPAVILSGMAHLNLLVLMLRPFLPSRTRILVRQNGALAATLEAGKHVRFGRVLFRTAYRRADRVICQTDAMSAELRNVLSIDPERLLVLPNPIDIAGIQALIAQESGNTWAASPRLIAVGRLAPEKGIDLLLDAFLTIKEKFPSANLQLAGTGPCDAALKARCSVLGIEDSVCFLGQVASPAQLFRNASVFVLASRSEGLPNALLEAAVAGLPIVVTPASDGLTELLSGRAGVWIAKEVSATALEHALCEALMSSRPGERFPHAWIESFELGASVRAYANAIDRVRLEIQA